MRENAFKATIDVSDVTRAYAQEFYRMFNKNFLDVDLIKRFQSNIDKNLDLTNCAPQQLFKKEKGEVIRKQNKLFQQFELVMRAAALSESKLVMFRYKPDKSFPRSVEVFGDFDNWVNSWPLRYD